MHHRLHQPHLPPLRLPCPLRRRRRRRRQAQQEVRQLQLWLLRPPQEGPLLPHRLLPSGAPDSSAARPPQPPPLLLPRHPISHLRRALSSNDLDVHADEEEDFDEVEPDFNERDRDFVDGNADAGGLPVRCLWEVLRRLPPTELLAVARLCKVWRETSRMVWRATEDLKLRVPSRAQLCFVGSVLNKCPELVRLCLKMKSDVDATMLACIAFSCPNLESVEISTASNVVNRITGDELGRFVADKRCLTCLKTEGCSNLGGLVLSSSSLSTL